MKKLMFAAAVAAMTGAALADAQVYEYKLTLKTTTCKEGKVAKNTYLTKMSLADAGDEIAYRTPASKTLMGVSWGCECADALFQNGWNNRTLSNGQSVWDGCVFWWKKESQWFGGNYDAAVLTWDMINRIGKKAADVEVSATLDDSNGEGAAELKLAGLGTIKDSIKLADPTDPDSQTDCASYIASAKGNVAGFVKAGIGGCYYCDDVVCDVYDFCDCGSAGSDPDKTVAYGTWTMKYNASASKKLRTSAKITGSYTGFPKDLKAELVLAGE